MRFSLAPALFLVALLASCGRGGDERGEGLPNGAIVPDNEVANVAAAPNDAAPAPPDAPLDRLAGVTVGSSIADLRAAGFAVTRDDGPDPEDSCGYARIRGLERLFFMLDGDRIVRIDVAVPGYPTLAGLAVGMGEAEALRRLGARAALRPDPLAGAASHLLVVHEEGAPFGLIAQTDGKVVLSYRLGRWAAVRSTENCL
jgi:hypothetical protein